MAAIAGHRLVAVRALGGRHGGAPALAVTVVATARHELRARGARIVVRALRIDARFHKRHAPLEIRIEHRALVQRAAAPDEARAAVRRTQERKIGATGRRGRTARAQARQPLGAAVAIDAVDLDRRGDLAVEMAVAVRILRVVAVDAMHAALEMDRLEMHRLPELVGIVVSDWSIVLVEEPAVARSEERRV